MSADMSHDRERRLEEVFSAAHGLPPLQRTAFLERACGGDAALRPQADSQLAAHERCGILAERRLINIRQE